MTGKPEGMQVSSQTAMEQKVDQVQEDVREMRVGLQQIAEAITRLAVVEERHKAFAFTLDRIGEQVQRIDERQRGAESIREASDRLAVRMTAVEVVATATQLEQVKFEATVKGIASTMKVMWAAFGGGVLYVGANLLQMAMKHI